MLLEFGMQILIKIAFVLCPMLVSAQISFYKLYADNGYDFGQGIVQLEDSSYVITGSSGSFAENSEAFLIRIDSAGTRLWSMHYGGSESEWGRRVLYKQNFGFFLCGHSNSFGSGDYDFYLVKTDANGNEEWSNTYGGSGWDRLMGAAMTRDTGTVLVGSTQNGIYDNDMYVVRTNASGDTLWTKTFKNVGDDIANDVVVYHDSLIVVAGNTYFQDSLQTKGICYLMHDDGTMIDTVIYSNHSGDYELNDILIYGDQLQGVGSQKKDAQDQWDYQFFYADLTGTAINNPTSSESEVDGDWHGDVATAFGDNSKRYMGLSFENNANTYLNGRDIMIQQCNSIFYYEATAAFIAQNEPDVNGELIRTSDGGAILIGYQQSPLLGVGGSSIFLYKIGPGDVYPATENVFGYSSIVNQEEIVANLDVSLYPNPASTSVFVEVPEQGTYTLEMVDASGKMVYTESFQNSQSLNVSSIQSGLYLVRIYNDKGFKIQRLILE